MSIKSRCRPLLVKSSALLLLAMLAGCGSSDDDDPDSRVRLEGGAAVGAAIVSGTVTAKCQNGLGFSQAVTTDSEGRWSGLVDNNALPCALQVAWGTPLQTLHSYTATPGVVNITPLTDLTLALESGQSPKDWFDGFSGAPVDLAAASDDLLDKLGANGFSVPASGNPFTTAFVADHTGWDALLDQIANAISADSTLADYAALVDLVKGGSLDNLPAAPQTYSITGTVTGASGAVAWKTFTGSGVLHFSGASGSGETVFTAPAGLIDGSTYQISIVSAPAGQECSIVNNSGSISAANITNVSISCITVTVEPQTYSISGTISGASANVVWETLIGGAFHHDGGNGNGAATFTQSGGVASGSQYEVRINTAPAGQTCSVSNGSGTLTGNVSNVLISCTDVTVEPQTYSISGTISGASSNVVWETWIGGAFHHDGGNGNGAVTFTQSGGVASGSQYEVRINTAPAGQTCSVTNGTGTLTAAVGNVLISCTATGGASPLYDFSGLNLQPVVPQGMTPQAPVQAASNPASQIASLYSQLGEAEKARIFAPAPANISTTVGNNVNDDYYRATQFNPDYSWVRIVDIGFGADGKADTADDTVFAYSVYPQGMNGVQYSFVHPGEDDAWFTADDLPGNHTAGKPVYFASGKTLLEFEGASEGAVLILSCLDTGYDGRLFTADDEVCSAGYQIAVLDGQDHRGQVVHYDNAGADGLWFTADDRVKTYTLVNYNAQGVSLGSVTYNGKGGDNQWFSSDDAVQMHTLTLLDEGFKPRYTATYNNRGGDSLWFTNDDVVSAWTYYGYDADGNNILVANHTDKRSDGLWFTADDTATALVSLKNAAGKEMLAFTISGSGAMGADGLWLSGDESLYGYSYGEFDANGYQTHRADFSAKGADGKWFTADDAPGAYNYWKREYNAQGRILKQVNFDMSRAPAAPAFSDSHISQYTVYNADFSNSVTLSASNFGVDGLPMTADDTAPWAYQLAVTNGFNLFNQPGADALWFTSDDVSSGYVRWQYSGKRKILEETFDASDVRQAYNEAVAIEPGKFRWNRYTRNGSGGYDLVSYSIIVEDDNGYPLWQSEYVQTEGNWAISYVVYSEHDANGNIIRQGWGYSAGADGIWATLDDFSHFGIASYTAGNLKATSSDERIGNDGIWGTADDSLRLSHIYVLGNDVANLVQNTGSVPAACDDGVQTAGAISVLVRDQNGAPLADVVAQLNQDGVTATTDANGVATFADLSGPQDLHLFKDGYTWESFYCVAPGFDVQVKGRLNSLTEAPLTSKVSFHIPGGEQVMMRLLDEQGQPVAQRYHSTSSGGSYGATYGDLHFDLPAGSEVSGELWVFKVDRYGKLLDAVSLGQQSYTTIASTTDLSVSEREEVTVSFSATPPQSIAVASQGVMSAPGGKTAPMTVELGAGLSLQFFYESALGYRTLAVVPDVTLPVLAQPLAVAVAFDNWSAWYPGEYARIGEGELVASIRSGFLFPPLVSSQDGSGSNPLIQWKAARELRANFATVNTLELLYSTAQGWRSQWVLHTPAGQQQLVLPTPPAAVNDPVLPAASYAMRLSVRAVPEKRYHDLLADDDLYNLDKTLATEVITAGGEFSGIKFER